MFYRNQSHNPNKHALMPSTYPWEIVMSDVSPTLGDGWTETTEQEISDLRASLDAEFQEYVLAIEQEQALERAKIDGMNEIRARIAFFDDMIIKFNFENAMMGITLEESVTLLTKVAGIQAAGKAGALETALVGWMSLTADRILTEERIVSYGQALADRVGMALPDRP